MSHDSPASGTMKPMDEGRGEETPLLPVNSNNASSHTTTSYTDIPTISSTNESSPFILGTSPLHPLAFLIFKWLDPLFEKGNSQPQLNPNDLADIPLPESCRTEQVYQTFQTYWEQDILLTNEKNTKLKSRSSYFFQSYPKYKPSIVKCLFLAFSVDFIKAGLLKLIHDFNVFVGPIVLHGLIQFLRNPNNTSISEGLVLTATVTISQIIMSFCLRHYFFKCYLTGLRMRSALVIAIYKKALVVSPTQKQAWSMGEIINLMTIDAQRIQELTAYCHAIWYSFLQIGLAIYFLWGQLGPSCLGGVAVILIMVPVNRFIAAWMGKLQNRLMNARDRRVDMTNEVLGSMKVVKLQAWETSFKKRIMELRSLELDQLKDYVILNAFSILMWSAVPLLVAVATFTAYTLSGHELDVASALTALALFDILRFPLFMLPKVINNLVEASVSFERVRSFLLADEFRPVGDASGDSGDGIISDDAGVEMKNATFVYDTKQPKFQPQGNNRSNGSGSGDDKKNEDNDIFLQEIHNKNWEIKLLQAQLADTEKRLMSLMQNGNHDNNDIEELVESIVPLVGEEEGEGNSTKEVATKTSHDEEQNDFIENLLALRRVNFQCKRGELIAIVGSVGSGKTTFINGILGEVRALSGTNAVKGKLAYCPQLPFIMNDTVKRNVLFGRQNESCDIERYNLALSSCALRHDLETLSDGDHTEIGEKGITLSGGQKARIGMTRAVYHDADIYLLDDPLAAVDAHVGKHLFQECIVNELLLNKSATSAQKGKKSSVILVTNAIQYLSDPHVDKIIVLDAGEIVEVGSYKELSGDPNSLFSSFLSIVLETGTQTMEPSSEEESDTSLNEEEDEGQESSTVDKTPISDEQEYHEPKADAAANTSSCKEMNSSVKMSLKQYKKVNLPSPLKAADQEVLSSTTPLMTNELIEREKGHVTWDVYLAWARAAGGKVVAIGTLLAFTIDQSISVSAKWFLTYWSKNASSSSSDSKQFLIIYAAINLLAIFTMFGRLVLIFYSGLRASRILFSELLDVVLQSPMSFFDTTPTGRIINRFSKDVYTVDEKLVSTMRSYLATVFNVIGVIVVISYVTPYFMICLIPMLGFYLRQQQFFTKAYRELKRLDSVLRSPLYALLGETLDGIVTIRAYNAETTLVSRITSMLDEQQNAYFLTCAAQCWLGVRLELVGTLIICSACLCAVIEHRSQGGSETFAGLAGLSISFALSVTQSLNWTVRMGSDLEANMVAVERIRQYCKITSEASHHLPSDKSLHSTWPSDGGITFSSAKLRYRDGLPLVLKGLDFKINPRSKVGVVGRTGAGKSTLMVSLLRIVELSNGSIEIDGINIQKVGLNLLRSSIAVIPQDPVLFSGSIRTNLDPFHEYTDEKLYKVLERVGLKSNIKPSTSSSSLTSYASFSVSTSNAVKSLSDEVFEGGSNFSVGQRQLLVIARSLLCGAKVVIMDEATASVDADTDARIQRVMRTEFKDSTCITVAHRINTIMDSDVILVMHDGKALEFDKPDVLLNRGGLFRDLVDAWEKEHG